MELMNVESSRQPTTDLLGVLNAIEEKNKPEFLHYLGDKSLLRQHPKVSIVGSRAVSEEGLKRCRKIVKLLSEKGAVIVSGLARGIDTEAHITAINNGAKTIAVLGSSLEQIYPKENEELQKQIAREHLLISQFPENSPIRKSNFPIRNRTMALISDCTVIIEAQDKSGSLHQGWEALRLGRPLFLLQSSVENTSLSWPQQLLTYGAKILSDNNIDDFLCSLPWLSDDEAFDGLPF